MGESDFILVDESSCVVVVVAGRPYNLNLEY